MPSFDYLARNADGGRVEGVLDAADAGALADALSLQGLMLVRAQRSDEVEDSWSWLHQLRSPRVQPDDLMMFCRQLAILIRAGVPLLRALQGLQESASNLRFRQVLGSLRDQLEGGRVLSTSMQQEHGVFTPYMISMVRVGETTGRLPEVFDGLFVQMKFERENREQVKSALRYPSFVVFAAIGALIAVNLFVIPTFAKVYKGLHAELPLITRGLIAVSDFSLAWWPLLLVVAVAAGVGLAMALRTPAGRELRDRLLLRLPIIGPLVLKAALARFAKSFGLALNAGVPLVDALQVAVETTGNLVLSARIQGMRSATERGESLLRAARGAGVFTPVILQIIGVGEETGALDDMMNEVADSYQKDVDYAVKALAQQIEPIIVFVLGVLVLVFALGVFLPMWDLSKVVLRQ